MTATALLSPPDPLWLGWTRMNEAERKGDTEKKKFLTFAADIYGRCLYWLWGKFELNGRKNNTPRQLENDQRSPECMTESP